MAFTLVVKNTSVAGKKPTVSQLRKGELGINLVDHKLYSHGYDENGQDVIFEIGEAGETLAAEQVTAPLVLTSVTLLRHRPRRPSVLERCRVGLGYRSHCPQRLD